LTLVNYVPDDVSEALFGLMVPLARRGDLVPSVLSFFGLSNPWSGSVFVLAIVAMTSFVLVGGTLPDRRSARSPLAALATVALLLVGHLVAYRGTPGDRGAQELLARFWLTPPGSVPRFWSTTGFR